MPGVPIGGAPSLRNVAEEGTGHRHPGMIAYTTMLQRVVQVLTLPSGLRPSSVSDDNSTRLITAKALGIAGVIAYNWWVAVPFVPGLMPSINGFFSDLEATGRPHAALMADLDLTAGLLMITALVLRGSRGRGGLRPEWKWMVAFAVAGAVGGRYTYACSEGLSATCRSMEWHLQLPLHHYIHVFSGIAEFATLTTAAVIARRRTRHEATPEARIYRWVVAVLVVGYPLLGAVYLTDRLGTLVEPIFFIAFSVMLLTEVFETAGSGRPTNSWADRVQAREWPGQDPARASI